MTVTVTDIMAGPFYPNGVTTAFPFDFKVPSGDELRVFAVLADVETTLDPGLYSVAISPDTEGGTVNFTLPPAASLGALYIEAEPSFGQAANFNNNGFLPRTLNPNFDRAAIRDLWLRGRVDRSLMAPRGEVFPALPSAVYRTGGRVIGFNAVTGALEVQGAGAFKGDPGGNVMAIGPWSLFSTLTIPNGTDLVQSSGYETPGLGAARYALDPDQVSNTTTRFRRKSANNRWFKIAETTIGYTMAGAKGDGVGGVSDAGVVTPNSGTDDYAAIQALYDYLFSIGGGTAFVEARQFNVSAAINVQGSKIRTFGLGDVSHVHTTSSAARLNVFKSVGGTENPADNNDPATNTPFATRWTGLTFENMRISGNTYWPGNPYTFNGVYTGNGIRTRWVDDIRIVNVTFDHLSDSGPSIRDGLRALVQGCTIFHVGQGIDIFYLSHNARVIGNTIRNMRVYVGINIEGSAAAGKGTPFGVTVTGNTIDGVVTAGIDIIECQRTTVTSNTVANVSGDHPDLPDYAFGIHPFGSPKTVIVGNNIQGINGNAAWSIATTNGSTNFTAAVGVFEGMALQGTGIPVGARVATYNGFTGTGTMTAAATATGTVTGTSPCGIGIDIAAGCSDSMVVGNNATNCSYAPCRVNDTNGTGPTLQVMIGDNAFDADIKITANTNLRARTVFGVIPQFIMTALSKTTRNAQIIFRSALGIDARFGVDILTNNGSRQFEWYYDDTGSVMTLTPGGVVNVSGNYSVGGNKVVGARGASLPANATDLATAIALVNAIKARMVVTGGHGLVAD